MSFDIGLSESNIGLFPSSNRTVQGADGHHYEVSSVKSPRKQLSELSDERRGFEESKSVTLAAISSAQSITATHEEKKRLPELNRRLQQIEQQLEDVERRSNEIYAKMMRVGMGLEQEEPMQTEKLWWEK